MEKDDFEELTELGKGSFGTCYKIKRKSDGKIFAWKALRFKTVHDSALVLINKELSIMSTFNHESIVKYYGYAVEWDEPQSRVYLIMEYCSGGSLEDLIARTKEEKGELSEKFVWRVFRQLIEALEHCHIADHSGNIIIHRDIKPANILLNSCGDVKIADFGCSRLLDIQCKAKTFVGSIIYMAPEVFSNEAYNELCDIWSLGCVLHELCALSPPFTGKTRTEIERKVKTEATPNIPDKYSRELNRVIKAMLQREPLTRPSAEILNSEIKYILKKREESGV